MRVQQIFCYPVKSCRGSSLLESQVQKEGLVSDRRFIIISSDNVMVTQRTHPKLALVEALVSGDSLVLNAPGHEKLEVPVKESSDVFQVGLHPVSRAAAGETPPREMVAASLLPDAAHQWITQYLEGTEQRQFRVAVMPQQHIRHVTRKQYDHTVGFADIMPILMGNLKTLDDINHRAKAQFDIRRFRPNLVVNGNTPFEEHTWKRVKIGNHIYRVVKNCTRCVMTTVNLEKGEKGKGPQENPLPHLLAAWKENLSKLPKNTYFGVYLIPESESGNVVVGDAVEVLERH